jgi:tetratricopeptide (TPR) repeat protein
MFVALMAGRSWADVIEVKGRPAIVGAVIVALHEGKLVFRLPTGREAARPIEDVYYLQIEDWGLFNLAEKQQREGELRQAVRAYEKELEKWPEAQAAPQGDGPAGPDRLDRPLLVRCRLLQVHDALGRFDRAVDLYLEVVERMPAALESLRPDTPPAAGSTFLEAGLAKVNEAIDRHGEDPIGVSLLRWRDAWPGQHGSETDATATAASRPAESPERRRARQTLDKVSELIDAERFDEAMSRLEPLEHTSVTQIRPEVYYWRGRALAGRAGDEDSGQAERDRRRAGLCFMRVVIHFPAHASVPECLYRAAELCRQAGQMGQAATLWSEAVRTGPLGEPWSDRARQALAKAKP